MRGRIKTRSLNTRSFCIFLVAFCAVISFETELCQANSVHLFTVTLIDGDVQFKSPTNFQWSDASPNTKLFEGDSLWIGQFSKVTLFWSKQQLPAGSSASITMRGPIMLRISPETFKDIKVTPFFVPKLPLSEGNDGNQVNLDDIKESGLADNVFQTTTQILLNTAKKTKNAFSAFINSAKNFSNVRKDILVDVKFKKMELLIPQNKSYFLVATFPQFQRIEWIQERDDAPRKKNVNFNVYFWDASSPRPNEPIGTSDANSYHLKVMKKGSYYVQIESSDGKFQSPANLVIFDDKLEKVVAEDREQMSRESNIFVRTLADQENFFGCSGKIEFLLKQSFLQQGLKKGYFVEVKPSGDQPLEKIELREEFFSYHLKPGEYQWSINKKSSVKGNRRRKPTSIALTKVRRVKIYHNNPNCVNQSIWSNLNQTISMIERDVKAKSKIVETESLTYTETKYNLLSD